MLDHYEDVLKELEEIKINLDNLNHNELRSTLSSIINRGWLRIERMYGPRPTKKHTKEEIQRHFDAMLNVVPITRIGSENKSKK
tara:strand:+ start:537 stop:788 length:252 start_codon:yes stop_codon:yes gene_type:complete